MRKMIVAAVALSMLAMLPSPASAETGSMNYIVSLGARVNHGITGVIPQDRNGIAVTSCSSITLALGGCIGGGTIFPNNDRDNTVVFLKMTLSVVDTVSGPNVYAAICNFNPGGGNVCDDGLLDGFDDGVHPIGCGVILTADATGVHAGNRAAVAFTHNLWVDPFTTEVCIGTSGTLNVLFFN